MQDFAPFIPDPRPQRALSKLGTEDSINLPATFQFSPATSKSIDIRDHMSWSFLCSMILVER